MGAVDHRSSCSRHFLSRGGRPRRMIVNMIPEALSQAVVNRRDTPAPATGRDVRGFCSESFGFSFMAARNADLTCACWFPTSAGFRKDIHAKLVVAAALNRLASEDLVLIDLPEKASSQSITNRRRRTVESRRRSTRSSSRARVTSAFSLDALPDTQDVVSSVRCPRLMRQARGRLGTGSRPGR